MQYHYAELGSGLEKYQTNRSGKCPEGLVEMVGPPPHYIWIAAKDGTYKKREDLNYIDQFNRVDSIRRALYCKVSDPLYIEALRHQDNGALDKASEFKSQAEAAVKLIKEENPWPTPPEVA
ncbi:hypothetical protein VAE122_3310004 [Vibrio aestuarianus]|nr:hypothetical protein VAE122_3310004 [Vibrio aestuarianus]